MKHIATFLLLGIFLVYNSCGENLNNYYSGIIVDELGRPVQSVLVKEDIAEKYSNKTLTDSNGFFKMNRTKGIFADLLLSKKGYLSDTVPVVWHQHGETTEFSSIIKKDSSQIVIRGEINSDLKFERKVIETPPSFDTIINSKYSLIELKGTWIKNEANELNGLKFSDKGLYVFGIPENRNIRYNIINDTITLYRDNYYFTTKGIIKKLTENDLSIEWTNNHIINYTKVQ